MYLVEQNYPQNGNLTTSASMNTSNLKNGLTPNSTNPNLSNSSNGKSLVNCNPQQLTLGILDSPLSSISSCESGIEQINGFNCDSDCLLNMNQPQINNYQTNSYIAYDKLTNKMKSGQELANETKSNQPMLNTGHHLIGKTDEQADLSNNKNSLLNYDYVDNKFDIFYSSWNSNESINNLEPYSDQLDISNNEMDYFMLGSRPNRTDENDPLESHHHLTLNASSVHNDEQLGLARSNRSKVMMADKKSSNLTASESQQLAELLTLNDLNTNNSLDNCIQLEPSRISQFDQTRSSWQNKSIFEWNSQELVDFLTYVALQYSYPVEDLRAYFFCYNPIQLANMDKEQMCCINSKYGPTLHQAIYQFKSEFANSFSANNQNYFNQQTTNFQTSHIVQPSNAIQVVQMPPHSSSPSKQLISGYGDSHLGNNLLNPNHHHQANSYLSNNLPSFDLLRNSCYDLDSTDQSPSSLSDSDRDSTSSSMTAVNEHLNRQNLATNCGQPILSNENELFCLSNALVDCRPHTSTLNGSQQFHSNQPVLQQHSNLASSPAGSLQSGNCLNGTIDEKKFDLNNNPINANGQLPDLVGGKTGRTNRQNGSLESTDCNNMLSDNVHHLQVQHNQSNENHHQSDDYSERINKNNSLVHGSNQPAEDANCHPSYAHHTLHLSHPNHLNHLGHPLNGNTVNKLTVSGRRGRPPKKDSKSRNRQSRGKGNGKLWEFIRDLLLDPATNPSFIRWERREDGIFKFVQSDKVAKLWGQRKQNPRMTYEKLSRAMRYYYKSQVLMPVFGRRLVYKFGPNATGWRPNQF